MRDQQATPILQRLLAVTSDCREAFAEAAYAVSSPRLASLFVRRADHQNRIAAYLTEHLSSERPASALALLPTRSGATRALRAGGLPSERDPHVLLGACIRVLDTAILEFARAFAPSMPLAQRISLERHHDQMRWSREELVDLQRNCKWQNTRWANDEGQTQVGVEREELASAARNAPPSEAEVQWFGLSRDGLNWADSRIQLIPSGATHFHEHESRRTS